jgi:hypothetical protein
VTTKQYRERGDQDGNEASDAHERKDLWALLRTDCEAEGAGREQERLVEALLTLNRGQAGLARAGNRLCPTLVR